MLLLTIDFFRLFLDNEVEVGTDGQSHLIVDWHLLKGLSSVLVSSSPSIHISFSAHFLNLFTDLE